MYIYIWLGAPGLPPPLMGMGGPPQVMVDAPPPVVWSVGVGVAQAPPPLWGGCGLFTLHLK